MKEINRERVLVRKDLKELKLQDPSVTLEPTKKIFLYSNKTRKEFLDGDDPKKQKVASTILWNLSLKEQKVQQTQYKSLYEILAKTPKNSDFATMLRALDFVRASLQRV